MAYPLYLQRFVEDYNGPEDAKAIASAIVACDAKAGPRGHLKLRLEHLAHRLLNPAYRADERSMPATLDESCHVAVRGAPDVAYEGLGALAAGQYKFTGSYRELVPILNDPRVLHVDENMRTMPLHARR